MARLTEGDDRMSDNPIHDAEREEWACAVAALTEMERAATEYDMRASMGMSGGPEDAND